MARERKTRDVKEAKARLKEYRENEPATTFRIKTKRIPVLLVKAPSAAPPSMEAWLAAKIAKADAEAVALWRTGACDGVYLYFKGGDLCCAFDKPDPSYELATSERLSGFWSNERRHNWIRDLARRLPILPVAPLS